MSNFPNDKPMGILLIEHELKTKYLLAVATVGGTGAVHMMIDDDLALLNALPLLIDGVSTIDDVCTRLNLLKALYIEHCGDVGTPTEDGQHWAIDSDTIAVLVALANAYDLGSAITLIGQKKTTKSGFALAIYDHGIDGGHHFHQDLTVGGLLYSPTVDPPTTLSHCIVDTNDILVSVIAHAGAGIS